MAALLRPHFPHRNNRDGTYDSICSVCYVTVASVENEPELAVHESAHRCEPVNLYRAGQALVQELRPGSELRA